MRERFPQSMMSPGQGRAWVTWLYLNGRKRYGHKAT